MNLGGIRIALLTVVLAARAWAGQSVTMRAALAGVAPDFCPALRTLVGAAAGDFASVRGKARTGSADVWEGTRRLPGGSECTVFGGTPAAYVCNLYAGDVEDDADGAYDRTVSGVKICLSGDWNTTEEVDGVLARTTTARRGAGPRVRVVSRDASGDGYLVELWVDAAGIRAR